MNSIQILDKKFNPYLGSEKIQEAIARMGTQISLDYQGLNPLFIGVLNGSFMFASDLFKCLDLACEISFVKLASYSGTASTGEVNKLIGLTEDIRGRNLIILEDIVDTGLTLRKLRADLQEYEPESMKLAALLYKPKAFQADFPIDYVGFEIPNDFIVGYGLDYNGYGRNYPDIYKIAE